MRSLFFSVVLSILSVTSFALPTIPGDQLHLGKVQFETSPTTPATSAHFILGLKYLHNFMYPLALREFKLAQEADPQFAMAYWGQAMCYKWSLWSYENRQKGTQVLRDFATHPQIKMTDLEKGMLHAIADIYKPGNDVINEKDYMHDMKALYFKYPNNPDVLSFYALSMLAYAMDAPYAKEGSHCVDRARALLKSVLNQYPAHPGINHYFMHANDMPNTEHPKEGLVVVPNVYRYLSDSSHVLHMGAHLYTALGQWPEAAHANALSVQASHRMCDALAKEHITIPEVNADRISTEHVAQWTLKDKYACDADNVYHSQEWLQYDDLQMGKFTEAKKIADEMQNIANLENKDIYHFWSYRMHARQVLYSHDYQPVKSLPEKLVETSKDKNWASYSECGLLLADGISTIQNKQMQFVPEIDARFTKIIGQLQSTSSASFKDACVLAQMEVSTYQDAFLKNKKDTYQTELEAMLKMQNKMQNSNESLTLPFVPAQEIYGELMGNKPSYYTEAFKLYQNELKYFPNRYAAVQGKNQIQEKLTKG